MIATLAGGCFWCTEAVFKRLRGVESVTPGYSGGNRPDPTYEEVCSGTTGHAEAVQVDFNPAVVPFETVLDVFFATHDPTTLNRQGYDVGTQYRSAVFYHDEAQKAAVERKIEAVNAAGEYADPVVTEVTPYSEFYPADDYHLEFYERNRAYPYCRAIIDPKIQKLLKRYGELTSVESA